MDAPKTPRNNEIDLDDEDNAVDADLILQHKENIQPLASGRRAAALAGSLTTTPKHKDTRLATERAQMEEDAEQAMDNDDDPLDAWIRYVDWTVDNYPQGVSAESGLLELLERATRLFAQDPRYKNDMRYLKLWIHYASYVDHPVKIFAYLNTNEIGTAYALFYEEYCNALERGGRREEAMEMYDIGIARRAHPLARLQARKRDFSVRMMSSTLPSTNSPKQASQSGKAALVEKKTALKRDGSENRNPGLGSSRSQAPARPGNNKGAFAIYTEGEGEGSGGNAWDDLESRDAHRKENYRSAVPAQGEILKQSISAPRTPRVDVYVDEGDEPKTPARPLKDDAVFTLSSKKPGADTLKRDPLRNHGMPPPEVPSTSTANPKEPLQPSRSKANDSSASSSRPKTSKSLPATKPNERLQIDISLLILADGTEIHPLERRARDFGVADKKWPVPGPEQTPNPKAGLNRIRPRSGDHETQVDFEGTKPMTMSSTMTGMSRDATVTINTKEALMAVYGMYNSPTKSLNSGNAFSAAMIDPRNADMPTPMASIAPRDENAGTARKPIFQPFTDGPTPSASRTSSENARTPGPAFRTPGANKGLSTGKRTLSLKQALQPVQIHEDDEDEEEYEPVTPAPLRVAKPLAPIIPFVDEQPKSSPANRSTVNNSGGNKRNEVGPREEEDLFAINPRAEVKFQSPRMPEEEHTRPAGIVDDEDDEQWERGEGEDGEDGGGVDDDEQFDDEEDYGEYPAEAARWAPALTPITERTYEHTGNSRMWTTPQEVRDRSVMDSEFEATRAFNEAERLAAELRTEGGVFEDLNDSGNLAASQSSWEEVEQAEDPVGIICDPYIKANIAKMVSNLPVPASIRDLRPKPSAQLEKLQKFVTPKGRKLATSTSRRDDSYSLVLDGDKYDVHRKLGEGGYGAVFLADDLNMSDPVRDDSNSHSALVAIKVVKPAGVWESYAMDRILKAVPESVRRSIISPRTLYIYQDESHHVLDYSDHGTLLEAVNKAGELKVGSSVGLGGGPSSIPGMDEMLVMFFTVELLKVLEGLHSAGFIHGDLKIDNCMVRLEECETWSTQYDPTGANGWSSKGIVLIDFGRAIDTSLYPRGTRFVTDWKMDKRDCLEMREGRPWTYETDYYGLAGIIYCMLYGKYMELPVVKDGIQRLSASLKRYWRVSLWERLFSALLNPNGFGRPLPIVEELADIRREMEAYLVENGSRSNRPTNLRALVKRLEALSV